MPGAWNPGFNVEPRPVKGAEMTPNLHLLHAEDHAQDLRARGAASRRVATSAGRLAAPGPSIDDVLIRRADGRDCRALDRLEQLEGRRLGLGGALVAEVGGDRKSTRLNSSHRCISYA